MIAFGSSSFRESTPIPLRVGDLRRLHLNHSIDLRYDLFDMALAPITATGKDKLEPHLAALCMNAGVPEATMDILGDSGLTTLSLMKNTLVDKNDWRDALTKAPFNMTGTDFATRLESGKLVGVYEAACSSNEVEVKANAERIRQNLPPDVNL